MILTFNSEFRKLKPLPLYLTNFCFMGICMYVCNLLSLIKKLYIIKFSNLRAQLTQASLNKGPTPAPFLRNDI